jgi:uncharacterized repeat protein (TIGR03803 family)
MKTANAQLGISTNRSFQTCPMTEPFAVRKPVLALLKRLLLAVALLLTPFRGIADVVFTTLHTFTGTNGAYPRTPLVQGSDGYLYGTTAQSGTNGGFGTIFKVSPTGGFSTVLDVAAGFPALFLGPAGNLYGTETTENPNTVFMINPDGTLTNLVSFSAQQGPNPPSIWVTLGSDGNFYAVTSGGGVGYGTICKITTNGVLTYLVFFSELDGSNPSGALVQGTDGYFYGTTWRGGTSVVSGENSGGFGTVFKMNTNGALATLYSFSGSNDGANPVGALVQASDGFFYGTTSGTIFRISSSGVFTNLYSFTGGNDGARPYAGLVQGTDGYLYGTTSAGGAQGYGTVFRISTNGALTTLHSFTGSKDGAYPYSALLQGTDGSFYGTTFEGGQDNQGTVFRLFRLTILPEFQAVTLTDGTLTLTWDTEPGVTYQLQYTLGSTPWINLGSAATATSATLTATDSVTNSLQRWYRLVVLP